MSNGDGTALPDPKQILAKILVGLGAHFLRAGPHARKRSPAAL